ncbi:MAG: FeoB-associated Cys-rich membrane protein [Bacilli bacterium]|nr:FeoB-associated Cys-rich membrane protein [Bacilli bacterium]
MKLIDYILIGIILALIIFIIIYIIKQKKKGKCFSCSGNCEGCKYQKKL